MYKYFGIALLGIFATMLIPISAESSQGPTFYGIVHVTTFDSTGNPTSTQTVHNALIDLGEDYLVKQLFAEGTTATADAVQIGTICVSEDTTYTGGTTVVENTSVSTFDSADDIQVTNNCLEDSDLGVDISTNGVAKIEPFTTFDAGTHTDVDQEITNIGICPAITGANLSNGCVNTAGGSNTLLFAIVNITNFTLGSGESATITYTFDVTG